MPYQKKKTTSRRRASTAARPPVVPESVLDEAARMFLESGFYRTRMQDIADSFGVTHAALYYHFKNKQDILAQINTRALTELFDGAKAIAKNDLPPDVKFAAALRWHMSYVASNPAFVATFLEHDLEIPRAQLARITRLRREYTHLLEELYDASRDAGAVPEVDSWIAVPLLVGACNWIYRWYDPSHGIDPDELVQAGMQFFEPILSATAEGVVEAAVERDAKAG
jgi:AcrR family transcriptional regulator